MIAGLLLGLGLLKAVEMGPHMRVKRDSAPDMLGLPSNATSIRESIATSFSCDSRAYGYYADPENDCQIFHVCLPVHFDDGTEQIFKWSFICPQETVFNQMYNKQKNPLFCLMFFGVWILDYLCSSHIVKLDSGQTRVEMYNGKGAQVVKNPHANQH